MDPFDPTAPPPDDAPEPDEPIDDELEEADPDHQAAIECSRSQARAACEAANPDPNTPCFCFVEDGVCTCDFEVTVRDDPPDEPPDVAAPIERDPPSWGDDDFPVPSAPPIDVIDLDPPVEVNDPGTTKPDGIKPDDSVPEFKTGFDGGFQKYRDVTPQCAGSSPSACRRICGRRQVTSCYRECDFAQEMCVDRARCAG